MHKHRLVIWIHDSEGPTVREQLADARKKAGTRLIAFSNKYQLSLEQPDLNKIIFSEHTVEDPGVDQVLRPLVEAEPEFMDQRIGMTVNQVSHPDEIELHERNRELRPALERAKNLEFAANEDLHAYLLEDRKLQLEFKKDVHALVKVQTEMVGQLQDLRQRVSALEVMR
jgi:hypothetical protein